MQDKKVRLEEQLADYVDGELDPAVRPAIEARLASDPDAALELERMRRSLRLVRELPAEPAPPQFAKLVQQRIRRRTHGRYFAGLGRLAFPYEAAASIVILLAMVVVFLLGEGAGELRTGHGAAQLPAVYRGLADAVAVDGGTVAGLTNRCEGAMELWLNEGSVARVGARLEPNLRLARVDGPALDGLVRFCALP